MHRFQDPDVTLSHSHSHGNDASPFTILPENTPTGSSLLRTSTVISHVPAALGYASTVGDLGPSVPIRPHRGPLRRPTRLQDGHRCEQERRGACTDPSWRWRGRGPQSPLPSLETPEALFSSSLVRTMDRDGPKKEALLFLSHRPRPLSFWAAGVSEAWQQGILLKRVSYYSPKRERGVDVAGVGGMEWNGGLETRGRHGWLGVFDLTEAGLSYIPCNWGGEAQDEARRVGWAVSLGRHS